MPKKSFAPKPAPKNQLPLFEQLTEVSELDAVREAALVCTKCPLHKTRTKVVFGEGKVDRPDLMIIGEGPGANEDKEGRPFVGRAGQLLNKMLEGIELTREDVYIANVVCCRPPKNRDPEPNEVANCIEYLVRQIRLVQPKAIMLVGKVATEATLNKTIKSVEGVRKVWYDWDGIPVRVTYHPAYLLRNPNKKPEALEDLRAVRAKIKELRAKGKA